MVGGIQVGLYIFAAFCFKTFMRAIFVIGFYSVLQTLSAQPLTRQSLQLVNTPKDELNPVVSPDGRSLYITVAGHPANSGK